jgi:mRNA interferase HigB
MHVVTKKHLALAIQEYPDGGNDIAAWHKVVKAARWRSFIDVRQVFKDADYVDGYVVFNIRQNRYRLITVIHYAREKEGRITEGHVYIRSFLTHQQYDNPANWNNPLR